MKKAHVLALSLGALVLAAVVLVGCCTWPAGWFAPLVTPGNSGGGTTGGTVEKSGIWIMNDLEAGKKQAKEEGKLLLIDFWADW